MISKPWRQRLLFGVLAVTVVFSVAIGEAEKSPDEPVLASKTPKPHVSSRAVQAQPRIALERLQRQTAAVKTDLPASNTFSAASWYVPPPPPPPPKPQPPPPPTAPPMPFSFMGRYEEGGGKIILLVRGDRIYTVSEGEVIDNTYRVERLAGGQLELTYLPLNIKQMISAGGT